VGEIVVGDPVVGETVVGVQCSGEIMVGGTAEGEIVVERTVVGEIVVEGTVEGEIVVGPVVRHVIEGYNIIYSPDLRCSLLGITAIKRSCHFRIFLCFLSPAIYN